MGTQAPSANPAAAYTLRALLSSFPQHPAQSQGRDTPLFIGLTVCLPTGAGTFAGSTPCRAPRAQNRAWHPGGAWQIFVKECKGPPAAPLTCRLRLGAQQGMGEGSGPALLRGPDRGAQAWKTTFLMSTKQKTLKVRIRRVQPGLRLSTLQISS